MKNETYFAIQDELGDLLIDVHELMKKEYKNKNYEKSLAFGEAFDLIDKRISEIRSQNEK